MNKLPAVVRTTPTGKKPKVTPAEINEIHQEYVSGKSITEIREKHKLTNVTWIYDKIEKFGWDKERDEFFRKSSQKYLDKILYGHLEKTEKTIDELEKIADSAIDPIDTGKLSPQRYPDAVSAYIGATDMKRKIRNDVLELSFVISVADILKQEIQDEALIIRIVSRLKSLLNRSDNKMLPSA